MLPEFATESRRASAARRDVWTAWIWQICLSFSFGLERPRFVHTTDIYLDSPVRSLALGNLEFAELVGDASRQAFTAIVDLWALRSVSMRFQSLAILARATRLR